MLQKVNFLPGFNKQVTPTGAEGQWTGGDNVRFRYGTPEKLGGWDQLGGDNLTGAGRALHHFDDNAGVKYAAIGTNRILYVYSGGQYHDIHPINNTIAGCDFSTTASQPTVTITFPSVHGMSEDDIVLLDNVTAPPGSGYSDAAFEDKKFMATSIPSATTITITMDSNASGTTANVGSCRAQTYYTVGPAQELGGFGWGTGQWSGTASGPATTTLVSTIAADAGVTSVTLTSSAAFPTSGTIRIGTEDITFTANDTSTGILSGGARAADGTTLAEHTAGATITNISSYVGWGDSSTEEVTLEPGLWVLDNYGTTLIALIYNGKCFEWDSTIANPTATRATVITGAPTASRHVLVSPVDRHLIFFGTETTIGNVATQDDMFIRFSDQESTSDYTPTATNTAGTQRLANGSKIMGAIRGRDAIYIWTDSAIFLMRFVGQPFTFSFEQVGTNCGLIGKNACMEVDGTAFWMSENGFFQYAGQLQSMPCLVEDYVFDDLNSTSRNLINCGLNNLFGEVNWFYCSSGSNVVDRVVTYNYLESVMLKKPIWYTGSLSRTAWEDSSIYDKPHACYYDNTDDESFDVVGNTDGVTIYYEHETGTDQVDAGGAVTAILANITSGDFDITQKRAAQGQLLGAPDMRGDGEYIMKIRRFIPDFISQTGDTRITLMLRDYPNDSTAGSSLGPFTISSSTDKVDTRARARAIALKIENTAVSQDWKLGTFRLDIQPDGRR
tara:strand:+ start:1834 stop:4014 length:2181 start_codon:yes stop_codon:yes gene_type:complete